MTRIVPLGKKFIRRVIHAMGIHKYRQQHGAGSSGVIPQIKTMIGALMRVQANRADCRSLLSYLREKGESFMSQIGPTPELQGEEREFSGRNVVLEG